MRCAAALCFVLLAASGVAAQPPATPAPAGVTLADLEKLAIEGNPTMRAAQARIDAARGRARQAGAWPNPTVGVSAEEQPFRDPVTAPQATHQGQTYSFCSEQHRQLFQKNPAKYLPKGK